MSGRTPRRRLVARAAATMLIAGAALPFATDTDVAHAISTTRVISEYRAHGPNGPNDEFIEIANISDGPIIVAGANGSAGFAVVASNNGAARCTIPNGTEIPRYGHYLCVNSVGYSLAAYPAGNGTTAFGDATYTVDVPIDAGLAIFDSANPADFTLAHRIDAVGPTTAPDLYREGAGHDALDNPLNLQQSFVRVLSTTSLTDPTPTAATPGLAQDTDDNAADFLYVNTTGTSNGPPQRFGAPGPENMSSPVVNGGLAVDLLDPCAAYDAAPNMARDFLPDPNPANNSQFGTVDYRRTITNNTGGTITRLRARITDLRTFPAPAGFADLRARTSTDIIVTADRPPCGSGTSNVTVTGTAVETPPLQPSGGAINTTLDVSAVNSLSPLGPGASIDVRFLFGVQQIGAQSVSIVLEALTDDGTVSAPFVTCLSGTAQAGDGSVDLATQCAAPVATPDAYSTPFETPLAVAAPGVLANDSDPENDAFTATIGTEPSSGTVVLNADGSFVYTPNSGFTGTDSFTYQATEGPGGPSSPLTTVTITVAPPTTTTTTTTEAPTTTEPPTTTVPPPTSAVTPPPTMPPTTVAVPELPATGGTNGSTIGLAAFLVLLGLGLTGAAAASRRHARR